VRHLAWYAEFLLEIDLKILLRKTGARLIFKIAIKSLHIDPGFCITGCIDCTAKGDLHTLKFTIQFAVCINQRAIFFVTKFESGGSFDMSLEGVFIRLRSLLVWNCKSLLIGT
jgi:hypothetical protein